MTANAGCFVVSVALVLTAAPVALAQQAEVKSATVTLVPKAAAGAEVSLENLRDSPLVAWEIGLFASSDAPSPLMSPSADFLQVPGGSGAGYGPIQPHETRKIQVPFRSAQSQVPVAGRMTMVVFEDGYAEGTSSSLQHLVKSWQERAEDLQWWVRVFDQMPRSSDAEARDYLIAKRIERAPFADPTNLRGNLGGLLVGNRPPGWLFAVLDREYRPTARAHLNTARRFLAREIPPDAVGSVKSVNVFFVPGAGTDFVLRLENLSDKPIEAWQVESGTSATSARSFQSTDACGAPSPDPSPGHGRLQPHEVREEPFSFGTAKDGALPVVKLSYVVFDDLSFEGSRAVVDELFHQREQRADDLAYSIEALKEAATRPIAEVKAFLQAKQDERARQAASAHRPFFNEFRNAINQLGRSPDRFAAYAEWYVTMMEASRTALLRHRQMK